jgi:membrane-associated phospholipid phosphatase
MKAWQRLVFGLSALAVLAAIGIKLHEVDMPVARFVRSFDIDALNQLGDAVALLGQGVVVGGAFALVGLIGWRLKRDYLQEMGVRGVIAVLGIAAISQLLKHLIGRPRPRFAHGDEFVLGPSLASGLDALPSGHAFNAFGAATVAAWYVPTLRVPLFLTAGLVGLSRIVRGSHFPTDVLAGAVLGVLIGSLAAAGLKRWREDALPGLLRVGVPLAVAVFLIVWVVLHPMPQWSQEIGHLSAGAALVLAGGLMRGFTGPDGPLRTAGNLALLLGVAVAGGPWWAGLLLLVALLPLSLAWLQPEAPVAAPFWNRLPVWGREALAVGSALLAIAALRAVKGLLPIA